MKQCFATILLVCLLVASTACAAAPSKTVIKTTIGDLNLNATELVNEVHDVTPPDGFAFLLLRLERADGKEFLVEDLHTAQTDGMVIILGEDNAPYACTMGGKLDDGSTVLACPVPENFKKGTLSWDGNPPIEIVLPTK